MSLEVGSQVQSVVASSLLDKLDSLSLTPNQPAVKKEVEEIQSGSSLSAKVGL